MTTAHVQRTALVFGASGFLGRWLVKELLDQGVRTTAAVRSAASGGALVSWLEDRGIATAGVQLLIVDLAVDGLGIDTNTLQPVRDIYNVAGRYAFGMTQQEARAANVETARRIVEFSATLDVQRLVHVSGYRVGGQDPASVPWPPQRIAAEYNRLGAYEASKIEGDAVVQAVAWDRGVPLTIANPSSVIGHSVTGESNQTLGLATTVLDLIEGRLRAVPGDRSTFVPVVTVDYLTRLLVLLPTVEQTVGASYWILDPDTPPLGELLRLVAEHHHVSFPWLRLPVAVIKRLPAALTHADPETLTFLSSDRYPTGPAQTLARAHGLRHADVAVSLCRWSDHLVRLRSGRPPHPSQSGTSTTHSQWRHK